MKINEILDALISELDFEKLKYIGLSDYQKMINNPENRSQIESDLPPGKKVEDIRIKYKETSIHIGENVNYVFNYFDLLIDEKIIGYYKDQYAINDDSTLEAVDDFFMIF